MNRKRAIFLVCLLTTFSCVVPLGHASEESIPATPSSKEYVSQKGIQIQGLSFVDSIQLSGRVQALWKIWGEDEDTAVGLGDVFEKEGFSIPRWRLGLAAGLFKYVELELTIGESEFRREHDVNVLDALVTLKYFDFANLSVGAGKVPVGRQTLTSSRDMQFVMRPVLIQQLDVPSTEGDSGTYNGLGIPERDVGITLSGKLWEGLFKYYAGIYNGEGEYFRGNVNDNYAYVVRGVANPLGDLANVEGDFFGCFRISLGMSGFSNHLLDSEYLGWGIDGEIKGHGLSVRAEFMRSEQKADLEGETVDPLIRETIYRDGFFVQAGYFVWPNYVELAYRYEQFDDNDHLTDNGDIKYHTIGANYYIQQNHFYKVQLNYIIREEDGPELDNDALYALLQVAF